MSLLISFVVLIFSIFVMTIEVNVLSIMGVVFCSIGFLGNLIIAVVREITNNE